MDLVDFLFRSVLYLEGFALLIGLIFLYKYWKLPASLIVLYLAIVFGVELINKDGVDNQWMYNLVVGSELIFLTIIFYFSVEDSVLKKIILGLFASCLVFIVCDVLLITQTPYKFLIYAFGFESLCISIMCIVYLFEMTRTEKVLYQNRDLLYWICVGLLLFHMCNLPITVLSNNLFEFGDTFTLLSIQSIASLAMYCCFIIGFIMSKWKYHI